ncbi:hypothetical protein [Paenibacillus macerans]|uniref:hypothetical protein n=1 Tax=Paenibacillus macerans TaxID=44252 RepID=UPI003D32138C
MLLSVAATSSENQRLSAAYSTASFLQAEAVERGLSVSILISSVFINMDALSTLCNELAKRSLSFILYGKQTIKLMQDTPLHEGPTGGSLHS